jgi:hypothetical protein
MEHKFVKTQTFPESRFRSWLAPHRIALIIMWLVTTTSMIVMLMNGVQGTNRYLAFRHTLHALYVVVLFWYLARTGPSYNQLPILNPQVLSRWKFVAWLPVLGIALIFWLNLVSEDGRDILILLMMVASVPILLAWLRDIRLRTIILGLLVALVAYLAGLQMVNVGVISKSWNITFTAFTLPMLVAGGLLFERTRLGGVKLLNGRYGEALKSLLFGCLLFVPLGLINAFGGSQIIKTSANDWWMPLWLPWWSGINEETWFRLYLVGLSYFLLRPALRKHQNVVVIASVLFSGIVFGVGHGRTLERFLTTGLLYGVPFAAVFAKRDWEHAVGAHYMVNMIPAVVAFLEM